MPCAPLGFGVGLIGLDGDFVGYWIGWVAVIWTRVCFVGVWVEVWWTQQKLGWLILQSWLYGSAYTLCRRLVGTIDRRVAVVVTCTLGGCWLLDSDCTLVSCRLVDSGCTLGTVCHKAASDEQ
eukprot:scaffold27841_cov34-Cyclotella_meneghiniana.AAC.4